MQIETLKAFRLRLPDGDVALMPGMPCELLDRYALRLLQDRPQWVRLVPPNPVQLRRDSVTLETAVGPQVLTAWLVNEALCVHRSIAVSGWTVSHLRSGKRIYSKIATKEEAIQTAARLLMLPGIDWTAPEPISPAERTTVFAILQTVPLARQPRWARVTRSARRLGAGSPNKFHHVDSGPRKSSEECD